MKVKKNESECESVTVIVSMCFLLKSVTEKEKEASSFKVTGQTMAELEVVGRAHKNVMVGAGYSTKHDKLINMT